MQVAVSGHVMFSKNNYVRLVLLFGFKISMTLRFLCRADPDPLYFAVTEKHDELCMHCFLLLAFANHKCLPFELDFSKRRAESAKHEIVLLADKHKAYCT